MQNRNISDVIEAYLKTMLASQTQVEIRRAEVAEQFNCVPSQINYVIKTRFTPSRGYLVESKRGGGGYIRILKVTIREDCDLVQWMLHHLPSSVAERDARQMVRRLHEAKLVDAQTTNVMLGVFSHQALGVPTRELEDQLRSRLLRALLQSLQYER